MRSISRVALIALAAVMVASGHVYSLEVSGYGSSVGTAGLSQSASYGTTNGAVSAQFTGVQSAQGITQIGGAGTAISGSKYNVAGAAQEGQASTLIMSQDGKSAGYGSSDQVLQTNVNANNKNGASASGINYGTVASVGSVATNVNSYSDNQGGVQTFKGYGPEAETSASQTNQGTSAGAKGASSAEFGSATESAANYKGATASGDTYGDVSAKGQSGAGVAGISNSAINTVGGYKQQLSSTNQAQAIGGMTVLNSQNGAGASLSTSAANQGISSYGLTSQQGQVAAQFSGIGDKNSNVNGVGATSNVGMAIGAKGTVTQTNNVGTVYSNAGASNLVGQYKAYGL